MKPLHQLLQSRQHETPPPNPTAFIDMNFKDSSGDLPPIWFHDIQSDHYDKLEKELIDFYNWAILQPKEVEARKNLARQIFQLVELVLGEPPKHFKLYGSLVSHTGLYFSDVDICIPDFKSKENLIPKLTSLLSKDVGPSNYLSQTRVPVIRGTEINTKIEFDISFQAETYQPLLFTNSQILILIVMKHFLKYRELDTPRYGGLSGFQLSVLVHAFAQNQEAIFCFSNSKIQNPHARLLLNFMEFLIKLNSQSIKICIKGNQVKLQQRTYQEHQHELLFVYREKDPENNLTGGVFAFQDVQAAVELCYLQLLKKCDGSILGQIFRPIRQGIKIREACSEIKDQIVDLT